MVTTNNTCPKAGTTAASPEVLALIAQAGAASRSFNASELFDLANIAELAAFAAEARRVLNEVDFAADHVPGLGDTLSKWVTDRCQLTTHDDCTAQVLGAVSLRLRDLAESACNVQMELGRLESRCQEGGASHG